MVIVLPKSDLHAKQLIKLSLYISFCISLFVFVILVFLKDPIISIFNLEEISNYIYLLPLVVMLTTIMRVAEQWFIRIKQFWVNAKATLFEALAIELSKVGVGLFYPTASVLILFTVLNSGFKGFLMIFFGRHVTYESKKPTEGKLSLKEIANKYKDFPLLRAPQAFIDSLTQGLPTLLLTAFFNPIVAGFYTLCRTVLTLPSSLLGKAVGDVFYPRINEAAQKRKKTTTIINKAVLALAVIGILPFGLLIIYGPWIFSFVFGSSWETAGEYVRWLAVARFFRFINEPCIRVLPVFSAQGFHLVITIMQTITRIIALSLGFFIFNDDQIAIALFGLIGGIINFLLIIITLRIGKKFDLNNLRKGE